MGIYLSPQGAGLVDRRALEVGLKSISAQYPACVLSRYCETTSPVLHSVSRDAAAAHGRISGTFDTRFLDILQTINRSVLETPWPRVGHANKATKQARLVLQTGSEPRMLFCLILIVLHYVANTWFCEGEGDHAGGIEMRVSA